MAQGTNSREELDNKEFEIAYNYVNRNAGNKTQAYLSYYRDRNLAPPKNARANAYEFFRRDGVQQLIKKFQEENRKRLAYLRDENIAMLRDIASNEATSKKDRIAAMKELNSMGGFNQQNISVDSDIDITITLEDSKVEG